MTDTTDGFSGPGGEETFQRDSYYESADGFDHAPDLPPGDHRPLGGNNLAAVRALNPRCLGAQHALEAVVMTGTESLPVSDRTLIALIVAVENRCGYWQVHLRRRLMHWFSGAELTQLSTDWTTADLDLAQRAMLAFAVKLAVIPGQMGDPDAQLLGSVGFCDRDLLDIVDVVSYWSFATRQVDGLGVYVEPEVAEGLLELV